MKQRPLNIYTDTTLFYGRLLADSVLCYTHVKEQMHHGS